MKQVNLLSFFLSLKQLLCFWVLQSVLHRLAVPADLDTSPVFAVSLSVSSCNNKISALLLDRSDCPNPLVLNNRCSIEHFPYVNTHTICIVQLNNPTVLMLGSTLFCSNNSSGLHFQAEHWRLLRPTKPSFELVVMNTLFLQVG